MTTRPVGRVLVLVLALLAPCAMTAATLTVTNTGDSGAGSLRQAILDADSGAGGDTITFNIPGGGPFVITPQPPGLPAILKPTTVDGTTQPGYAGTPIIEIANFSGTGLKLQGGGSTVRGVVVRGMNNGISMESNNNHVEGCYVGTDVTGTLAAANGTGITVQSGSTGNTIGGSSAAQRNLISANVAGIALINATNAVIQGNYIGTTADGTAPLGNSQGILATATTNLVVGGSGAGEGNVIAASSLEGIYLTSGSGALIQGNRIGTNAAGTEALGNDVGVSASSHTGLALGGNFNAGEGNLISGNTHQAVLLASVGAVVKGNTIGLDVTGQLLLGNGTGIEMDVAATDCVIGSIANGEGNAIAWNDVGIYNYGVRNSIRGNPIFFNGSIGIDNDPAGVTINDAGDADTGANELQNFPFISSVDYGPGPSLTAHGILQSTPNVTFDLDFYESPSCTPHPRDLLQSAYYIGSTQVTTDGSGNVNFDTLLSDPNAASMPIITVTATDPAGNTSEFSQNVIYASSPRSGPPAGGVTVTLTGTHFVSGATVTFGGVPGTNVTFTSETSMKADAPALSAATVNDIMVTNTDGTAGTLKKAWIVDFLDVPPSQQFYTWVTTLVSNAITVGVGSGNYGVADPTLRQQMAVFLLKGRHGICYVPPTCQGVFGDVACPSTFADWIEALAAEGITGGCGGGNYCPTNPVRRDQMAVFLLKAEHGSAYVPPACLGIFADVPCPSQFANWIEQLSHEGITGGCGGGNYCPQNPNTRGQMAVFLVKTFGLQ